MRSPEYIKEMLLNGFCRFYNDSSPRWSKQQLRAALRPEGEVHELDSPEIQRILRELEEERHIKLFYHDDLYLEVLHG